MQSIFLKWQSVFFKRKRKVITQCLAFNYFYRSSFICIEIRKIEINDKHFKLYKKQFFKLLINICSVVLCYFVFFLNSASLNLFLKIKYMFNVDIYKCNRIISHSFGWYTFDNPLYMVINKSTIPFCI